jgi:hypothetical protein
MILLDPSLPEGSREIAGVHDRLRVIACPILVGHAVLNARLCALKMVVPVVRADAHGWLALDNFTAAALFARRFLALNIQPYADALLVSAADDDFRFIFALWDVRHRERCIEDARGAGC